MRFYITSDVFIRLAFLLLVFGKVRGEDQISCNAKEFSDGAIVCVCNATYCDTVPHLETLGEGQYVHYTSNKAGLRFEKVVGRFEDVQKTSQIIINAAVSYQTIYGFGGAFTDATGINVKSLSQGAQNNLLKSYFSNQGIQYSLCRIPMGGTDFSTHGYSYDDGNTDTELNNFSLTSEDYDYKIPLIKTAQELTEGNIDFIASVWTAPKWMKTNNDYSGFGFLKTSMYQTWANYFIKFLDEYKKEDIEFWGITTGNEPSLSLLPISKINSVGWTHTQMRRWVSENLGPTIRNSEYSNLKIITLDDQRFFLPWYIDLIFQDKDAKNYIDGIAVHWYWDKILPASLLTKTYNNYPDKFIISTEASIGDKPWEKKVDIGAWSRGEDYFNDILQILTHWGSGWIDWNMALNTTGGPTYIDNNVDSAVLVNATADEFYKQPMFYALGHFSKFIPANSVRISAKTSNNALQVVAVRRPDNGTVITILNKNNGVLPLVIADETRGKIDIEITGRSFNTIVYW